MSERTAATSFEKNVSGDIDPMPLWEALFYFGLPVVLFRVFLYAGIPAFAHWGMTRFEAYIVGLTVPAAILFALAFGFYKRDGYSLTWNELKERFRLHPMTGKDWLWSIVLFVVTFLSIGALAPTAQMLIDALLAIAVPDFFAPWARPGTTFDLVLFARFVGAPLKGNWVFAVLSSIQLFFNIFGEEFWWRGYILP